MRIIAVILSIGERTEELSVELMKKQVSEVKLIRGLPMGEAFLEAYRSGLGYDRMVLTGADCLIKPAMVNVLLNKLEGVRVSGCCHTPFRGKTPGGIMLYDGARLRECIEVYDPQQIRPERHVVETIGDHKEIDVVTCLHEYELYYRDLYHKYQLRIKKWPHLKARHFRGGGERKAIRQAILGLPFNMKEREPITNIKRLAKKYKL